MAKRKKKGLTFKKSQLENTFYTNNPLIRNKTKFKDFTEAEKTALYNMNPAEASRYFENPEAQKAIRKPIPAKPILDDEETELQQKPKKDSKKATERAENAPE